MSGQVFWPFKDSQINGNGCFYPFDFKISQRFNQTLAIESGSDNTYTESISSLGVDINDALALVVSYTLRNNSDVLPGTEKTDTFTAITIEYSY